MRPKSQSSRIKTLDSKEDFREHISSILTKVYKLIAVLWKLQTVGNYKLRNCKITKAFPFNNL